ncbi:LRR and NB-ARC domains-containing disease resistance protein, putative [Theobroma cacao]|uniref:LRR and NB-ARC domains-containing disease resistance protein, putative n=1 Tax=Theobroma cacao TaxID=3641 RepID=A0A061FS96_THECC|nr:LRR and NB-ARC domains-containing disease resistance protein, putative [Theobroma cacao]
MVVVPCLLMPWMNKTHDFVSHSNALKIKVGKVSRQHILIMGFIGEVALSAFFDSLFAKFFSSKFNFVTEKRVRKEIMNWETTLKTIRALLPDAEEKKMKNLAVKIWLADLQDLAYDVDDILDEFATEALRRKYMKAHQASTSKAQKFLTSLHPSSIMFNYKMMSEIKEIMRRLEDLAARKSNLQLREIDVGRPMPIPKSRSSTSLYSRCYLSNNVLNHLLSALKCVRVLSLKRYYITEIPSSIGNLKHLYYPDFSYTKIKSLPDSIYSLYNLETLLLRFCENFEKLSLKLGILDNLCHLDITGGNSIEEMPSGIGKLKNLQVLSNFIVGQGDGLNIREMGNLSNLKDQLCIFELHNVDEAQYAWEAKLSIKPDLENLELKWSRGFNENLRRKEVEKEVLNSLQPHKDIKELAVKYYGGIEFPDWVEDDSFKNMQVLRLEYCQNCILLPAVGKLPLLKHLYIKGMGSVINVGNEFHGVNGSNAFPSLETLHFEDMLEWKEWKLCEFDEQGKKFCCLQELFVKNCPKLVTTLLENLNSLEKLVILNCQELVVSVLNLPMLCELEIKGCKEVVLGSYDDLQSLKKILLSNILKFACVTKMKMLQSMKVENLQINNCEELICLWQTKCWWLVPLRSLRTLMFNNCSQVVCMGASKEEEKKELLELKIPRNIEYVKLQDCEGLERFSKTFHNLTCLTKLVIVKCPKLVSLSTDNLLPTLRTLEIDNCENMESLIDDKENINFSSTYFLQSLYIRSCEQSVGNNTCLESITLWDSKNIKYLPQGLDKLNRLQEIQFLDCPNLVRFPKPLPNLHHLQRLIIWECPKMQYSIGERGFPANLTFLSIYEPNSNKEVMEGLHRLTYLTTLWIDGTNCMDAMSFPQEEIRMKLPPSLTDLFIRGFKNLRKLSSNGFQNITSLQSLSINNCPKLKSIPREEMLPSLLQLCIRNCPVLKKRCKKDKGKQWSNITHIPYVTIDDRFIHE